VVSGIPFGIVSLKQKCFDAGIDIEIERITKEIPLALTRGGQKKLGLFTGSRYLEFFDELHEMQEKG